MAEEACSLDYETKSACSLKAHGSWRYGLDATTDVLCASFRLPYWPEGQTALWHPSFPALKLAESPCPELREMFEWVLNGGPIRAHNSAFERSITCNIMTPRYGWPAVPIAAWRCSASVAAAHALPRGLDDAVAALGLSIRKDAAGSKVMKKLTKPRKPRKAEREAGVTGLLWWESVDLLEQLFAYCRQDVLVEEALSEALDDLSPSEQSLYTLDQRINERGFRLDREAVRTALVLIDAESQRLNAELATLTGGAVKRATHRAQLKRWLEGEGLYLEDTQAGTLDALLSDDCQEPLTDPARQALTLLRALGRSSTAKYEAMRNWMCPDDRVHGGLIFHGASTGRWTGTGVQPHNFPRGTLKNPEDYLTPGKKNKVDMEDLWFCLKGERQTVEARYGGVLESLSHALRGAIVSSPGKQLYVSDFAGIETRVLMWQAGEEGALAMMRAGGDLYIDMASDIYDRPVTKEDAAERQLGKVAILALGFQQGWSGFQKTALTLANIVVEDELSQRTVAAYRGKYVRVVQMWGDQEAAAIAAVQCARREIKCGKVTWFTRGRFLHCRLPSGRLLSYADPQVDKRATPWGAMKPALSYMGINAFTRKWQRQHSYGGLLVENCQAEGTEVLTHRGWIAIEVIQPDDLLWDGDDWTTHGGILCKGVQSVLTCDGVRMTPEHKVLTIRGWVNASSCNRLDRSPVRLPDGYQLRGERREEIAVERALCVRDAHDSASIRTSQGASQVLRVQNPRDDQQIHEHPRHDQAPGVLGVAEHVRPLPPPDASSMEELWGAGDPRLLDVAERLYGVLGRHGGNVSAGVDARAQRQQRWLRARQLLLGHTQAAVSEQTDHDSSPGRPVARGVCRQPGGIEVNSVLEIQARVFDVLSCGLRQRFVVRNREHSRCLIVHNCTQAISRDLMAEAIVRIEAAGLYATVLSCHDEVIAEATPVLGSVEEFGALMAEVPSWADGLPIATETWAGPRYRKG